jgi:polysaccharide deacetylase family protein (PEP-CTERM system associated)
MINFRKNSDYNNHNKNYSAITVDVEDWFHILDSGRVPNIERWASLESRIEKNIEEMLTIIDSHNVKVTFFWLGWLAERHKNLVRKCKKAGHEIASHGYAHILAYKAGEKAFKYDITRAKVILEDIIGEPIRGFRSPGFGITKSSPWAFDVIAETGYQYDSSIFPASREHGGISDAPLGIYFIETRNGHLLEVPMSVVKILRRRTSLFGGGYLRLANKFIIKWGIDKLKSADQPLIVYIHPREIDPDHPRLNIPLQRRFKCYVNLKSTLPKLKWLCENYSFCTMLEVVENYIKTFYSEGKVIPVVRMRSSATSQLCYEDNANINRNPISRQSIRAPLLRAEKAMARFLVHNVAQPHVTGKDSLVKT